MSVSESDGTRWDAAARRARILEILDTKDFVGVKELSEEFGLTEMSVRRDLTSMVNDGLITRVRGGAAKPPPAASSPQYAQAANRNVHAKRLIAARAVELLSSGLSAFFYSGSTVARVAASLPDELHSGLTVVTNSLPVIEEVSSWQDPHLVAIGGTYLHSYMTFVGPQAVGAVEEMHADVAVIGCDGLSSDGGLTTPHQLVAEIGSTIVRQASRSIVVADSTKIGKRGSHRSHRSAPSMSWSLTRVPTRTSSLAFRTPASRSSSPSAVTGKVHRLATPGAAPRYPANLSGHSASGPTRCPKPGGARNSEGS